MISRQRILIALRSFPSVAAAARSIGTTPERLLRATVSDPEVTGAYEECLHGVVRQRSEGERDAEKRQRDAEEPRVTERTARARQARWFAATGRDPRLAAGALHARLNREARETKAAAIRAAIVAVDAMLADKSSAPIPPKRVLDVFDRWCANCKAHRVDDPCEVCARHTLYLGHEELP